MSIFRKKRDDRVVSPEEHEAALAKAAKQPAYTKRHTLVVYKSKDGWRWRLVAPNGKLTAESGEAYIRRFDCKIAALRLTVVAGKAKLQVEGDN